MLTDIERRDYITSTDIASILGVGFQSPEELCLSKWGLIEFEETPAMAMGKKIERFICSLYAETTDLDVRFQSDVSFTKGKHFACTPDALVHDGQRLVRGAEFKNVSGWMKEGWSLQHEEPQRIPMKYYFQIMFSMYCLDIDEWDISCLINGNDFRTYRFTRDRVLEAAVVAHVADFRERYILPKILPEDYESPEWAKCFKKVYSLDHDTAEDMEADDRATELMEALFFITGIEKKCKSLKEKPRNMLLQHMTELNCNKMVSEFGTASINKKGSLLFKAAEMED